MLNDKNTIDKRCFIDAGVDVEDVDEEFKSVGSVTEQDK